MDPLLPSDPERIGRYRLTHRLGAGGMGQVYLARTAAGRTVVVKVIRPEHVSDGEFRARFAREAGAARTVGGFHTAQVVDADPEADPPWIATAHIVGPSLHQFLREQGALAPPTLRVLAAGLAEGLEAIHSAGLVHRDLKPGNVILAEDGPRIIDFGIARPVDTTHMTMSGAVLGTVPYMSPEQTEGLQVGPASDVFSLGTVLAFAATGTNPYAASTPAATIRRIIGPTPTLDGLPDDLTALITGCWDHDPDQRLTPAQILARFEVHDLDGAWPPATGTHAPGPQPPPKPPATPAAGTTTGGPAAAPLHTDTEPEPAGTPDPATGPAEAAAEPAGDTEPPEGGQDAATAGRSSPGSAESAPASQRPGTDDPAVSSRTRKRAWVVAGAMLFMVALVAAGAVWLPPSSTSEPTTSEPTTPEQEPVTTLDHDATVRSVEFAPEGDLLATGGVDGNARLWDVKSGEEVTTLDHGDGDTVWPVTFTADGGTLTTTGGLDMTTRVWDVESGQEISSIDHDVSRASLAFALDGDLLAATGSDGAVDVWDVESGEEISSIDHGAEVESVEFTPDGGLLATVGGDGAARLWDVESGEEVTTFDHGADVQSLNPNVQSVEFTPDGELLATVGGDGAARLWDVESGEEVTTFDHGANVESVKLAPGGDLLATGGVDGNARVWDVESGEEVTTFDHGDTVLLMEFAPEGDLLATGGQGSMVQLWDVP